MAPVGAARNASGVELPAPLATARSGPLFGRTRELAACARTLAAARLGAPRVLLVTGEPGIGKTRLAAEAALRAAEGGSTVLYGRCPDSAEGAHRPFAEAFGAWVKAQGPEAARGRLGDTAPAVATLTPLPDAGPAPTERHGLYGGVAEALARVAGEDGLLLVLDDLHAADEGTLAIVRHLLRAPGRAPVALLGLLRAGERGPHERLVEDLAGREGAEHLTLAGLAADDAGALVAHLAGRPAEAGAEELGRRLAGPTGGNPLYLSELVAHLVEQDRLEAALRDDAGALGDLPAELCALALARVERLGPAATTVLTAAALAGGRPAAGLIAAATDLPPSEVGEALDAACRSGLLVESGDPPGLAFAHDVIARALAQRLSAEERARLHAALADALEAGGEGDRAARVAALARHRLAALPARPHAAAAAAAEAGRVALERLAPHQAVSSYAAALDVLERFGLEDPALRDELRTGLGMAQRRAGDPAFRATLLAAARSARDRGDAQRLREAALGNSRGFVSTAGEVDEERVELLEAAMDDAAGAERAELLALLAAELTFAADGERRRRAAEEAVAAARAAGDAASLCRVVTLVFCATAVPETLRERLAAMREAVSLADRVGAPLAQFEALHWLGVALVQAGRLDEAVRTVDREVAVAERLDEPAALWLACFARANLHATFGRLEHAEELAGRALEHATASGQPDALVFYALQLAAIRFEQGRLGELQSLVARTVAETPGVPALRALLALALCEAELPHRARQLLAADAAEDFRTLPEDMARLVGLTLYADVAARVGDAEAAATLAGLLEPWADQVAFAGIGGWGQVRRALGRAAGAAGELDEAERGLAEAAAAATRAGAPLWAARAQVDAAEVLLHRRREGDRARARRLLEAARAVAQRLLAAGLERRARTLLDRERAMEALGRSGGRAPALTGLALPAREAPAAAGAAPAGGPRVGVLRREGELWHLELDGRRASVRDGRGVRHLLRLLAHPGEDVAALELAAEAPAAGGDALRPAEEGLETARADAPGEAVLDEAAKQAVRARLAELEQEREEAERFRDRVRAARAAEELEALRAELGRALGLRGRDRRAASPAERARVSVTRALRRTLERIAAQDEALGRELDAGIRTGALCSYRPAPGRAIEWRIDGDG